MGEAADAEPRFMSLEDIFRLVEEHRTAGRLDAAEDLVNQVLAARPNEPGAVHYRGIIAHQSGHLAQAIELVKRATELAPDVALFQANLGEMYRLAGRPDLAIAHGERALVLRPDYPEALSNVGIAHYDRKDYERALVCHRRAAEMKPDFAPAHGNLGNTLHALKRFDEALPCYRRAVELDPGFAEGWSNLGITLQNTGRYDEAISALRRAVALDPKSANAHSGLGILLLMRGDMAEGWAGYEWRLKSTEVRLPYHPQRPWQGESLQGRRIDIHAEQGFGDTLQFARYVRLVAARGATVTFHVQQGLAGLMRQSLPGIEVLGDRSAATSLPDCECALLSLPHLFGTRIETIPASVPYLHADAAGAARWRARFAALAGIKVGLVWAGNPEHANDQRRSIDLASLAPLFDVPGASFVSLQVGPRAADIAEDRAALLDISADLVGFADTAAALAALDLVVTIDSAVVHLAGALAKPTWLLVPWVSDWRWLRHREDSPWYPTLRLFRQIEGRAWREVAAQVASELAKAAAGDAEALTPFRAAGEKRAAEAAAIIAARERQVVSPPPDPRLSPLLLLATAERRRRDGRLAEAETLARRVLEAAPENAEAHHLLGVVAHQSGHLAHAIAHVERAASLAPDVALYHANLGEMYRLAGRLDAAVAAAERALALQPQFADAFNNLGIALYEKSDFDAAVQNYARAIALKPAFAEAHSNLGNALRALKRYEEAEPCYRRALALKPQFADAWNNLGTTLRDLKCYGEAESAYGKALTLKPDEPETLNNLALALKDLNRPEEAEATLRRSLAIETRNGKTLLYLAAVLLDREQPDEAANLLDLALALDPASHDIPNLMGRVAFLRGDIDAALHHYRRALELKPDLADALNNMGNALKDLGRLDEARSAYREALAIDPDATGIYVNYADSVKFARDDPYVTTMEAMRAGHGRLSDADRLRLDFALAKAYADLKDHERSFAHLLSGNALKRTQIRYDEASALAFFDRIESVFTPELVAEMATLGGEPSAVPIFILGMPRSGTTLVEQILASHPQVFGAGELKTFSAVMNEVHGTDGNPIPYPDFVPALDANSLAQIGTRYLAEIRKRAPAAPHITDKMPSNYYFAGLIHLALPNARIIHTVRDPVDTCLSCFSKLFSDEQNHTYDLGEIGRYHRRYQALMVHWRRVLPPGRILDVRYEDVVDDLEGEARRLVAHCGLDWDARCLAFHKTERPVRTASATQVRQPIYRSAVGRGRAYEDFLGPLRAALNGAPAPR